jgi:hypothetical protein
MSDCADDARLIDTYRRTLAGRASTNQLIEDAMYLADAAVASTIRKFPPAARLADDLRSAAYVAITEASQELSVDPAKVVIYLATAARHGVQETIAGEDLTPPRRQREGIEPQRFESLSDAAAAKLTAPEDQSALLLDDILLGCCIDDLDRSIVRLRAAGHTDAEVAASIGLSESAVRNRRKAIEARFVERNPEYQQ